MLNGVGHFCMTKHAVQCIWCRGELGSKMHSVRLLTIWRDDGVLYFLHWASESRRVKGDSPRPTPIGKI